MPSGYWPAHHATCCGWARGPSCIMIEVGSRRSPGILIWLYFVLALVAPLGIWFVQRRYRNLFALWSVVTSVYVWSTLIFSPDLVPRYYCVLPPLLLALFMLLLDGFLYGPARTRSCIIALSTFTFSVLMFCSVLSAYVAQD